MVQKEWDWNLQPHGTERVGLEPSASWYRKSGTGTFSLTVQKEWDWNPQPHGTERVGLEPSASWYRKSGTGTFSLTVQKEWDWNPQPHDSGGKRADNAVVQERDKGEREHV
uniref:Uncharacterized protein n=1 Tax=Knipowitschia caucasica TaxID=637954 RepID=A0AAV2KIP2_KNICA